MEKIYLIKDGWTIENASYGKFKARVPGDISDDLYTAGVIPDPVFGLNFQKNKWVLNAEWEYKVPFIADKSDICEKYQSIRFDGVDTFSEVYLNGVKIGETSEMFIPYEFSVNGIAKEGENLLSVRMKSPYAVYDEKTNDKYMCIFKGNRLFFRKPACHFEWDWAPDFPGYGIYKPVKFVVSDEDVIKNVKISTENNGRVSSLIELTPKFTDKPDGYELKLIVREDIEAFPGKYAVGAKENDGGLIYENKGREFVSSIPVGGKNNLLNAFVEDCKLWFPNGYGEQNMYEYKAELIKDGITVSEKKGTFAFREIKISTTPLDEKSLSFKFVINGKDVFGKGSNWVPASNMTGAIKDETYINLINAAKEAGYTILRVWGGGFYENDIFYDLCDRAGIMVWQDFMFACSDLPDDISSFRKTVYREAEYQLKRLRNHPSIVLWCGGNERRKFLDCRGPQYGEYIWEVLLRGLHDKLSGETAYVPNSPHAATDVDMDWTNGDLHTSCYDPALIDDKITEYRKYLATNVSPFTTECAILGPCRMRSLRKFLPEESMNEIDDVWHAHFMLNPYSAVPEETFITKEERMAKDLFGDFDGISDFVKKAMAVHSEIMRSEIEYARWSKRNNGILNWMFNDIWGCGTWSVVDFYGEKKPVFFAQKSAFKPLHAFYVYNGNATELCVSDHLTRDIELTLRYGKKTFDGEVIFEEKKDIKVTSGRRFTEYDERFDSCEKNQYLFVEVSPCGITASETQEETDKSLYYPNLWKDIPCETDISAEKIRVTDNEMLLKIKANKFARTVFIDMPYEYRPVLTDNYFDMEKGEERIITVRSDIKILDEEITIKTFADDWDE